VSLSNAHAQGEVADEISKRNGFVGTEKENERTLLGQTKTTMGTKKYLQGDKDPQTGKSKKKERFQEGSLDVQECAVLAVC